MSFSRLIPNLSTPLRVPIDDTPNNWFQRYTGNKDSSPEIVEPSGMYTMERRVTMRAIGLDEFRWAVCFRRNSDNQTVVVICVRDNDDNITIGTEFILEANTDVEWLSMDKINDNKFVVYYRRTGDSATAYLKTFTTINTTISLDASTTFGGINSNFAGTTKVLSSTKGLLTFRGSGGGNAQVIGYTIGTGTLVFDSGATDYLSANNLTSFTTAPIGRIDDENAVVFGQNDSNNELFGNTVLTTTDPVTVGIEQNFQAGATSQAFYSSIKAISFDSESKILLSGNIADTSILDYYTGQFLFQIPYSGGIVSDQSIKQMCPGFTIDGLVIMEELTGDTYGLLASRNDASDLYIMAFCVQNDNRFAFGRPAIITNSPAGGSTEQMMDIVFLNRDKAAVVFESTNGVETKILNKG